MLGAQEENQGYRVEIWTRRIGGSAPEKCWTVPGREPFATLDEAEQESRNLFEEINGVSTVNRSLLMRPHNGWWRASSAPRRWIDLVQEPSRWEGGKVQQAPLAKPAVAGKPLPVPAV